MSTTTYVFGGEIRKICGYHLLSGAMNNIKKNKIKIKKGLALNWHHESIPI